MNYHIKKLKWILRSGLLCLLLLVPFFVVRLTATAKELVEGQALSGSNLSAPQDSGAIEVAESQFFNNLLFSKHYNWSPVAKEKVDRQAHVSSAVIYVKADASGANNGTSWANAYADLQAGLAAATSGDQIWVAAGSYKPTSGSSRTVSFQLKSGVGIYGGFDGTESSREQRDWENNVTILSGDIGTVGDNSDNSYHVVNGSGTASSAILDGFTVTAGYANGGNINHHGAGVLNYSNGNPTLSHVIITGNSASNDGGGMFNYINCSPTLNHVIFSGNSAVSAGGGMLNHTSSNPTVSHVTFAGNSASSGGGMYNYVNSSPSVSHVIFSGNSASNGGGGMHNHTNSSPTLSHVTFTGNSASLGGGMANNSSSHPTIRNSILWNNKDDGSGDTAQISNTSSTPSVSYSLVQGGWSGTGNVDADPLFVSPLSPDDAPTTGGDFHLQATSPAIDAGNNSDVPADTLDLDGDGDTSEALPFDLDGLPRFADGPMADTGSGTSPIVDLGPYEHEELAPTPTPTHTPTPTPTPTPTDTPATTVQVISSTVPFSDQIAIPLSMVDMGAEGVGALNIDIEYDPSVLQATGCVADPDSLFEYSQCNLGFAPNKVRFTALSATGVSGDVALGQVTWKALGDPGESSPLALIINAFAYPDGDPISTSPQDGQLTIRTPGDVSCDGLMNVVDILFIMQYVSGTRGITDDCPRPPEPPQTLFLPSCDVNNNGACGMTDGLLILRCIHGYTNKLCPASNMRSARAPDIATDSRAPWRIGAPFGGSDGTLTMPITVNSTRQLGAATIDVEYDPNQLLPTGCTADPRQQFDLSLCNPEYQSGTVRLAAISAAGKLSSGEEILLAEVTFQPVGDTPISAIGDLTKIVPVTFVDPAGQPIGQTAPPAQTRQTIYLPLIQK
ncbi:MAG: cohesin domain-containing protein [Ardenticatenaceae bacterium]